MKVLEKLLLVEQSQSNRDYLFNEKTLQFFVLSCIGGDNDE